MTKHIIWTVFVRGLIIAAAFLSSVITARLLGPEGRGIFFYWTTLIVLAVQFGNLGLHSSNTYLLSGGQARLSTLAGNSLWVSLVAGTVLWGVLILFLWLINGTLQDKWPMIWPILPMIPAGLYFLLGINLLVAEGRIGEYNVFELTNRYLGIVILLFAAWYWPTPQALLVAMGTVGVFMCLVLYHRLRLLGGSGQGSLRLMREGFGYAMRAYLATALGFAVLRLNTLLLEQYKDAETLGTWSIAAQIFEVIATIPGTIAMILFPKLMRSGKPYPLMRSQLPVVFMILTAVCAAAVWLGKEAILLVYGEDFINAYVMLLWGLPGMIALSLTTILSQYLATLGMPFALIRIWLAGVAAELILAMWLIPIHGGAGAAMSLSAAYIIVLAMVWSLTIRLHGKQKRGTNG